MDMRSNEEKVIVVSQMETRSRLDWHTGECDIQRNKKNKRLLRYTVIFAAVSVFLGIGGIVAFQNPDQAQTVMSHMTAEFEYDETLGRLQFVSNILPKSALVFLENEEPSVPAAAVPADARLLHAWSQEEPWFEYNCVGEVTACQDGQIMTIVKNRDDQYSIRIGHPNGYESLYSGLHAVQVKELDTVRKGQQIGFATGFTAFEWRKDGLSVLPVQSQSDGRPSEI